MARTEKMGGLLMDTRRNGMDRIKTKTPLTAAKKKEAVKKLVFTALMFIFVYIMIFPLLWMVSSSLKSSDEVFRIPFQWLPESFRWSIFA